jgi:hypothetical protein
MLDTKEIYNDTDYRELGDWFYALSQQVLGWKGKNEKSQKDKNY